MIYYACPVASDLEYSLKKSIVLDAFNQEKIHSYFPLENSEIPSPEKTLSDISNSRAFIADIAMERPSVYFELGIAAAFDKDVYVLAEKGTPIHQLGNHKIFQYANINEFAQAVKVVLELIKVSF